MRLYIHSTVYEMNALITTGNILPIRAGSIGEFMFHVWICSIYTNSSTEPVRIVCSYFDGRSRIVSHEVNK